MMKSNDFVCVDVDAISYSWNAQSQISLRKPVVNKQIGTIFSGHVSQFGGTSGQIFSKEVKIFPDIDDGKSGGDSETALSPHHIFRRDTISFCTLLLN